MDHRTTGSACRARGIAWFLTVLGLAAAASPVLAGEEGSRDWYLAVDAALTQPEGLQQQYAVHQDFAFPTPANTRLMLDNDPELSGSAKLGYGFGGGKGSVHGSFWIYDHEDKTQGTFFGEIIPTVAGTNLFGPSGLFDNLTGVDVKASGKVKATLSDLAYVRPFTVSDRVTVMWLAGLRYATYAEFRTFEGIATNLGTQLFQENQFSAVGLGLRMGAAAHFGITSHFGLDADTAFSFLQARSRGEASQESPGSGFSPVIRGEDENLQGKILDFGLRAHWTLQSHDLYVGYAVSSWEGMVIDPAISNGINIAPGSRGSVSFNSLHAGVTFRYGGAK